MFTIFNVFSTLEPAVIECEGQRASSSAEGNEIFNNVDTRAYLSGYLLPVTGIE